VPAGASPCRRKSRVNATIGPACRRTRSAAGHNTCGANSCDAGVGQQFIYESSRRPWALSPACAISVRHRGLLGASDGGRPPIPRRLVGEVIKTSNLTPSRSLKLSGSTKKRSGGSSGLRTDRHLLCSWKTETDRPLIALAVPCALRTTDNHAERSLGPPRRCDPWRFGPRPFGPSTNPLPSAALDLDKNA
jgi:hypothetical protein